MPEQNFEDDSASKRAEEKEAARSIEANVDHGRLARLVANKFASARGLASPRSAMPAPDVSAPKKSSAMLLAILVALFLLVGLTLGLLFLIRHNRTQTANGDHANASGNANGITAPDGQSPGPVVKNELIQIPGGTFQMGRNDGMTQEGPAHSVTVKSFLMDKTEVTNAEYAEFVKETNHAAPLGWTNGQPPSGQEQWPVTNVTIKDVEDFIAWRSKHDGAQYRLPTEEEWEYAARNGDQNTLYPWGNSWADEKAVLYTISARPVGSIPEGQNRWGVVDLIGNVWEWMQSKASVYPGNALMVPEETKGWVIIRGGSYLSKQQDEKRQITSTYRDWVSPTTKNPALGFRLVRNGL